MAMAGQIKYIEPRPAHDRPAPNDVRLHLLKLPQPFNSAEVVGVELMKIDIRPVSTAVMGVPRKLICPNQMQC
ncbi:hypothetical protein TWF569_009470 [Orbilia oligospora]|uniref:Uncharacterized protein n=1 Tax=Orbilia oligospora TaxID=2813651 RepID=A0A7C8J8V0_ORBOL|nr:hypothetical protein TWF102_010538 [Orbilia oligospora]KAF3092661.1 hypothetical protein TWF706_008970 [Orbilia oligospora]KAF3136481.1 hypothetical protein TWF569_009470 [Orbilia oligospora]